MLIDWFTVGAQALNFVFLIWLMKRFLYGPILKVVDARDQRVAAELADAGQKQLEAKEERDTFQKKNAGFDQERERLMQQAKQAADAEGIRLLEAARQAAKAASQKLEQSLSNEADALKGALAARVQQEVFAISRKVLADLASESLEARVAEAFVRRLRELDEGARAQLTKALQSASEPALVRTALDLPLEQREAIQQALSETASMAVRLRFETAPDLVSGVELTANGQKLAWSIAESLRALAEGVDELIGRQSPRNVKPLPVKDTAAQHAN